MIKPDIVGPTGKMPKKPVSATDAGGLRIAISVDKIANRIVIEFGTPVAWMGLDAEEAESFIRALIHYTAKIKGREVKQ